MYTSNPSGTGDQYSDHLAVGVVKGKTKRREILSRLFSQAFRRLYYSAILAPKGYGTPVSKDTWEHQYKNGVWDKLNSIHEFAHYMVIVGYVHHLSETPKILDVGCG